MKGVGLINVCMYIMLQLVLQLMQFLVFHCPFHDTLQNKKQRPTSVQRILFSCTSPLVISVHFCKIGEIDIQPMQESNLGLFEC